MYVFVQLHFFKKTGTRYIIFGLILLLPFERIPAQTNKKITAFNNAKIQKAEDYFNRSDYLSAIEIYKDILAKTGDDTTVFCKIGDAYRLLNDSKDAEDWYRKAITGNEKNIDPEYLLYFGQVLTANNKYDEALYWYKEYYKARSNDMRALESINSLENISELYYDTTFFVVFPVDINTEFSEYCPVYYEKGVFFLSDRASKNSGFTSWYLSECDSSGKLLSPEKYGKNFKTKYNEGPVSFYDHFKKMIFSQNYSRKNTNKKSINEIPLQLFTVQQNADDQWEEPELLPFTDDKYSYTQPSVTQDGKTLYFSSNMPGGYGGADIYVSRYNGSTWSDPVNLGNDVNSPGDEMFPFIFQDSILYFSSNGHGGLGSLDIFRVNLMNGSKPRNLGAPLNSSKDDFGFVMDNDGLSGYISSNRPNGKGGDDIYGFKQIRISFTIRIIDKATKLPVSEAEIYSLTDDKDPIGVTGRDGSCTLIIPVYEVFRVRIKKENYESKVYTFRITKSSSESLAVIPLQTDTVKTEKIVLTDENNKVIENPQNVVYKVQIWASRRPAHEKKLKRKYKGPLKISAFQEDRWYKYSIGEFATYTEAKQCLINCDVDDAFIIAYIGNRKVYITVAKEATNEKSVLSPMNRDDIRRWRQQK